MYLYGDSAPSGLRTNFIELVRRALDFSVQAVQADLHVAEAHARRVERELRCREETAEIDALEQAVSAALAPSRASGDSTPARRCADAISRGAGDAARAERETAKASLATDVAAIEAECARERAACVRAFEALVLRHDLPQTTSILELATTDGLHYSARLRERTPYRLEWTLELEIPASHPFAHDVRVERLLDGLEIHAPEAGGMFRKQVRLTPHKLGKHHVVAVIVAPGETRVQLRESHEKHAPGFDLVLRSDEPRLEVKRVGGKDGDLPINEATDAERARFVELDERLRAVVDELATGGRKALVEARFEDKALAEWDRPSEIVERLVAAMAPVVQEIARHSLTHTELVLKRALADDRREEIFVSKAELRKKLDVLPEAQRMLFAPLALSDGRPAPLAAGSGAPAEDVEPTQVYEPAPGTTEITDGDLLEIEVREP